MTIRRQYEWRGKIPNKTILADSEGKPISVSGLGKNINDYFWYRRQVSEGTKGPILYEFTRRRVVLSEARLPKKAVRNHRACLSHRQKAVEKLITCHKYRCRVNETFSKKGAVEKNRTFFDGNSNTAFWLNS